MRHRLGELLVTTQSDEADATTSTTSGMVVEGANASAAMSVSNFTDTLEDEDITNYMSFNKVFYERRTEATDALNLARILFDLKEYRKCAHVLKPFATTKHQSALFLRNYSLFLVHEQQKEEENLENGGDRGAAANGSSLNKQLVNIENELM